MDEIEKERAERKKKTDAMRINPFLRDIRECYVNEDSLMDEQLPEEGDAVTKMYNLRQMEARIKDLELAITSIEKRIDSLSEQIE